MPAPASNEELFSLIAKSGVLDDVRVKAYLTKLAAGEGVPADPIKLGGLMVRDGLLTHFQAEQLLQGRWKRFSIGKYKVLERLGVGGMGQVFLCEHKLMKRKVAVKVLPAAKAKDQAALQRFYREARAVAAVDHPNIVRAYDIDDDADLHFLVMEYVDGANLHDIVRKSGPMPPLRACHYVYGAAVGLQHAYEIGLVHRDIKPANILVDRTGVVKILDMGLARFFQPDDDDHLTKKFEENVLGTADYLAPEQAMDSTAVDIRADIYGLGGTFYFMLTGHPPFPDGTVAQKLLWHQTKPPKPITDYRKDVPPQLVAIVNKMLAKEASDRYTTPADLMAALAPWVQTPIPPPTDAELPNVSVAAGGKPPPGSGGPSAMPTPRTVRPAGPRSSPTVPVMPSQQATPAAISVTPAPDAVPVTAPTPPANPWADLRTAETMPTAQETTRNRRDRDDRSPSRSGTKSPTRDLREALKRIPLLWLILTGCGMLLLGVVAVVAVVLLISKGHTSAPTTAPSGDQRVWYVAKSGPGPNGVGTKASLAEALRSVKSGDEVVILDDNIEIGPIPMNGLKDVRITAAPGKTVHCVYKGAHSQQAVSVIHIRGCENITLSGLNIDAGGHDIGIQVSGKASGVLLDKLTVRNARKHAVNLLNLTADPSQPLTVSGCRLLVPADAQSGVNVSGSSEIDCRGIRVLDNRFEGAGGGSGVRVDGACSDVEVKNNRLFNFDAAVFLVADPSPPKVCQLAIERNTFHTAKVGVRIDQPPAAERSLSIARNYFAAVGTAAAATDMKGVKVASNGRDVATQPGITAADEVAGVSIAAPAPDAADDKFLRPAGKLQVKEVRVGAE